MESVENVVIRFAGDSGDGMQLLGTQFTHTAALAGNDLATLPDFPAEIRAPAGTRAGVSSFQLQFADHDIFIPGDRSDVLVAMNPAALVTNVSSLDEGGLIVVNTDKFAKLDLDKADLTSNPLEDGTLENFRVLEVPMGTLTRDAVTPFGLNAKQADRCKNFFALGMMYWLYSRSMDNTRSWIEGKFSGATRDANLAALEAGWSYADTIEFFHSTYRVAPANDLPSGIYRNITGNQALAIGLVAACRRASKRLFYGTYPITPASDVLHALAPFKNYGVITFQAEDEIAAVCSAIGASYGGSIGITGTSGPGLALKGEALGLAVMTELPLVVLNIQRGGPSTGLPTKTEQADLLQAMYGRNGEAPCAILAPSTPTDCFEVAFEAVRLATRYMCPVIVLSDGYIANGAEPWRLPDIDALPEITVAHPTEAEGFQPYSRDDETLARPWAIPGTPGLEHRIGGLEKQHLTGNVSYDPENHHFMCELRAEKIRRIQQEIPATPIYGDADGLCVLGWGSTYGAIRTAVDAARAEGRRVGHVHLRHISPFPADLEEVLAKFDRVLVPEMNLGQLVKLIRERFLIDAEPLNKVQGKPFRVREIKDRIDALTAAVA